MRETLGLKKDTGRGRLTHWVKCESCGTLVEVPRKAPAPENCSHCPRREDSLPLDETAA